MSNSALDQSAFFESVAHDMTLARLVLNAVLEHTPEVEAQLAEGLAAGNQSAVIQSAHRLKGTFLQVFASETAELARLVEYAAREGDMETCRVEAARLKVSIRASCDAARELLSASNSAR